MLKKNALAIFLIKMIATWTIPLVAALYLSLLAVGASHAVPVSEAPSSPAQLRAGGPAGPLGREGCRGRRGGRGEGGRGGKEEGRGRMSYNGV